MTIENGHYIDYNYPEIFQNIFNKLGLNNNMNLNNLNTQEEYDLFVARIKKEIMIAQGLGNEDIEYLKRMLFTNIDNILYTLMLVSRNGLNDHFITKQIEEEKTFRENHKDLKNITNKNVSWKNLMYYTATKAIEIFSKNDDIRYYKYAKNYYKNVSTNPNSEYPKAIHIDGIYYRLPYPLFNHEFKSVQEEKFQDFLIRLDIEDKPTVTLDRTLKKGKGKRVVLGNNPTPAKKRDYAKIDANLDRKLKFYKGLSGKVQGIINGFGNDTDYIGYVLPNNYVVFDKFYEISKDGSKVVPSYGARVYIVTLDVYEACDRDRSKISNYITKQHDYKARRFNHTDTDSYQERVNEALDYHDVSLVKFKDFRLKYENNQDN